MSRLNGRAVGLMGQSERDGEFEPSCLVRTPSGNVYIPSGTFQVLENWRCSLEKKHAANLVNTQLHGVCFLRFTDIPIKSSPMDYKSNSSCSSPSKMLDGHAKGPCSVPYGTPLPGLPARNTLRRPNSSHFPPKRFPFRKSLTKCSWRCTAIVFIILSVVLFAAVTYMSGK